MQEYRDSLQNTRLAALNVTRASVASATLPDPKPQTNEPEDKLQSVLQYDEQLPEGTKRILAGNLTDALLPCRILLKILLRFPLQLEVRSDFARQFTYSWTSFASWMFFISGFIMLVCGFIVTLALAGVMLNIPPQPTHIKTKWILSTQNGSVYTDIQKTQEVLRLEEIFLLQRNFIPVLIALFSMIHICCGN